MIKKTALLALILGLMVMVISPVQAKDESAVTLTGSAAVVFPEYIDFNLSIQSEIKITDIRLQYIVKRHSFADVTQEIIADVPVSNGSSAEVYWRWDMRTTGSMPSGAIISYRWLVTDINGGKYETAFATVRFDDNNYLWQGITEGDITLYWYQGNNDFAAELMQTCQNALIQLGEDMGVYLDEPVRIYIYSSSSALQNAMIFAQEWAGGVAYTNYGAIAIGISKSNMSWGKRAIVHELAHLVTYQMTSNAYNSIPIWLNEGISMYAEGELENNYEYYLESAALTGTLISVQTLCSPFSSFSDQSYLSYAESYSLVEFLIENYGHENIYELLSIFKKGSTYDDALLHVYGFDTDGLNDIWQDYITNEYRSDSIVGIYNLELNSASLV